MLICVSLSGCCLGKSLVHPMSAMRAALNNSTVSVSSILCCTRD